MKKARTAAPEAASKPDEATVVAKDGFFIVGIGASAGGLAAFEEFFSGMPPDSDPGMAFVLVQHLDPDHKSLLTDLIRRYTRMRVFEVEDGMTVEVNCVYIIPPGHDMAFLNGSLQLLKPSATRGLRLPIDFFFRSLAQDQAERSIGIVLSGTGSDGSLGIRAIKGEAGMVMVQSPESSEYDGMPRSALATGLVDYELPPEQMAAALIAYTSHAAGQEPLQLSPASKTANTLKKIFILLRNQTGHDFSQYKPNTIMRRIERRMAIHQIDTMDLYVRYLQQANAEIVELFRDLLIGVTNFFRDPEAFKALEAALVPKLLDGRNPGSSIRVWLPGCSTGEEAYSIAILLVESMEAMKLDFTLEIFATDIDAQAITSARSGVFPASIAIDISKERLDRFFVPEAIGVDGKPLSYRTSKKIRDFLIFSEQNVIKDPPFSKLDLISCRNLLIYLGAELQKRLIPLFHYALNPGGLLFLGTSETVGDFVDLFDNLDRKAKLYQSKGNTLRNRRIPAGSFLALPTVGEVPRPRQQEKKARPEKLPLRELTEQTLLRWLAPSSALVNGQGDIFYLHGHTGMYLEPATGEVGAYNILKMAREGLQHELASALHTSVQTKHLVKRPGIRVKTNGHYTPVDLSICMVDIPVSDPESSELYLVVFAEGAPFKPVRGHGSQPSLESGQDDIITSLQKELKVKEEYLQSVNLQLENSNEELKSFNEEMQSVNEEMQSTNEELETSKEELQSVNEELSTVNAELQTKVADLSVANNDMNNLLAGTGIATVFVDHQMRILRFTPTAKAIINLVKGDVGRPIHHFVNNLLDYKAMTTDIQAVLDNLIPLEVDVLATNGSWFNMRIVPYRTIDNIIEGAVVTFVDISERKQAEEKAQSLLAEKELILREVNHRIKNNMGTMKAMLNLKARSIEDPNTASALMDASDRMLSMEILYDKLYQSSNFSDLSVKVYLSLLVDGIASNYSDLQSLTVGKYFDDFILDAKRMQPLGIIINELLTNVFK